MRVLQSTRKLTIVTLAGFAISTGATAAPVSYQLDPGHTYPSIEIAHMGLSVLRGKFNSSSGKVVLDRAAQTGSLEVTVDTTSIDFGHDRLNEHVMGAEMLDVKKHPTAIYRGTFAKFKDDVPSEVQGELTLHGVTKPVTLTITQFLCKPHPMKKVEVCGADAIATIRRAEFGIDYGKAYGHGQEVTLRIQAEGLRVESSPKT